MTTRERVTLTIDTELVYQAKILALQRKIQPRDIVELALQQFFKNNVASDK